MPKRKEAEVFADVGKKDCWHSYSLQVLAPGKFARVVGNILKGNYVLVNSRMEDRASA
ncbi:MAG: hypothetical protein IPH75_03530 [bacterium]|nr:hypothetical protein [bacterium]